MDTWDNVREAIGDDKKWGVLQGRIKEDICKPCVLSATCAKTLRELVGCLVCTYGSCVIDALFLK